MSSNMGRASSGEASREAGRELEQEEGKDGSKSDSKICSGDILADIGLAAESRRVWIYS